MPAVDIGQRFDRLVVMRRDHGRHWLCVCDCGKERVARQDHLKTAKIRSCGCFHDESARRARIHGFARKGKQRGEYKSWLGAVRRCTVASAPDWHNYGGRGISICKRWAESFEAFLADMGRRPGLGYSIDRIDNDGNYEPGNCRWATVTDQVRNRRCTVRLVFNGESLTIPEWAERIGVRKQSLYSRRAMGWPVERMLTEPAGGHA